MRTYLEVEHYSADGKLKGRLYRPSHSWVIGFLQLLYLAHQTTLITYSINTSQFGPKTVNPNTIAYPICKITGGWGGADFLTGTFGEGIGIVIGGNNTAENSGHITLGDRFNVSPRTQMRTVRPPDPTKLWQGVACDGTNLWFLNTTDNKIHKCNVFTGAEVAQWAAPFAECTGVCYDPTNDKLWGSSGGVTDKIYDMDKTTGASTINWAAANAACVGYDYVNNFVISTDGVAAHIDRWTTAGVLQATVACIANPISVTFNGTNYLVAQAVSTIYEYSPAGALVEQWAPLAYIAQMKGMQWQNPYLWLLESTAKTAFKINPLTSGMELTPTELADWDVTPPDASFLIRAFATNNSGGLKTIREIGIQGYPYGILLARDVLGAGDIALLDGEMAKIQYQMKITV